jgi:hypothetical protein
MSTMHLFSGTVIGPTVQLASAHIAASTLARGGAQKEAELRAVRDVLLLRAY